MLNYMTVKEAAEKWGVGSRSGNAILRGRQNQGSGEKGNLWLIPCDAPKPDDRRNA